MTFSARSLFLVSAAVFGSAALIGACGSDDSSTFDGGVNSDATTGDGSSLGQDGSTIVIDDDGGTSCVPQTCATLKAGCGPQGDGCGKIIECGTCNTAAGESCGGGGVPSVCGKPACKALTCTDLGANCGQQGDGCGNTIDCGTCNTGAGEFCGGGGPSKCGLGSGGGDAGADSGVGCTPKLCADLGANCGQQADGCGGLIASCGTCDSAKGESCGGGGVPSVCGKTCVPLTQCPAGLDCGAIADGCGGVVSCGGPTCSKPGDICGGGGTSNVCGGGSNACTGLCTQQTTCANGGTTSISGTVTTPNGVLPVAGALVYVPNGTVQPFTTGVSCQQCGAETTGTPLVSTTTGADGKFLLPNVPVSSAAPGKVNNIPVVIQLGRWRKQFTIVTTGCTNTVVPAGSAALPKNKSEGDIPLTAISTGNVDGLECVFRKIGIDDAEFTDPSGNGRIRLYKDNGAVITPQTFTDRKCEVGGAVCTRNRDCPNNAQGNRVCLAAVQTGGTPAASTLYNDAAELAKYDMTIFECVGGRQDKSATARANVLNYANSGGRVYATHFSYVWLYNTTPWSTTASWGADQDSWNSITADIDTTFGKGQTFAQWLNIVGGLQAPLPATPPPWVPAPKITISEARHDVDDPVVAPAQRWLYTTPTSPGALKSSVQHYTFNTDYTKPAAQQCGRVLFSDFHVTTGNNTGNVVFPNECDNNPLTTQEKVLAFMLFDLASCVTSTPPTPPTCKAKTCAEQGLECGQAGDGCGNIIDCPPCGPGLTCGGAGVPSKCGKPACTPKTCTAGQCGTIADGCGGTVDCPPCANGTCGGGGVANMCGVGSCTPSSCPTPAQGSACGPVANGCGQVNQCACPANVPCVNGKCGAPSCTPRTCASAGANCGSLADGCGGILDCGTCLAPQVCGAGVPNLCGGGIN